MVIEFRVVFGGIDDVFTESWCHDEVVEKSRRSQAAAPWNHGQPPSPVGLKIDAVGGKPWRRNQIKKSPQN